MKKLILALSSLAALFIAQQLVAHMEGESMEWMTLPQALQEAPKANKKILLDVYTDWCGWCKRMDRDTYSDKAVATYMRDHYVASRMNPEKEGEIEYDGKKFTQAQFGQALGITGYPATAMFNEKGELLTVIGGYMKSAEFLRVLKYFGEDIYLQTEWKEYVAAHPLAE